jgi:outer membrane biosynthesis protein TonB
MNHRQLQRLIVILLLGFLAVGCTGSAVAPAATATSLPPADTSTVVPPTPTSTAAATPVPPTSTPAATATPRPPTNTPTVEPTETDTPTATLKPKPTITQGPKPTARPSATQAPPAAPSSGATSVTLNNTFPVSCVIAFWGPAEFKLDAPADGSAAANVQPGTYGWRAFLGGAETGEAGNFKIARGSTCVFVCDKDRMALRYGCR